MDSSGPLISPCQESTSNVMIAALVTRAKTIEAENKKLRRELKCKQKMFRLDNISDNDSLIRFYTGFPSYSQLAFYEFLGPAVNYLRYWGDKSTAKRKRKTKLDPLNQLFLTLIKLRLDLWERDIAY